MPNYIQFRKNDEIVASPKVDDMMREHFGAEPDPKNWYRNWYNCIGIDLAFGMTRAKIEEEYPELLDITKWLFDNFTFNAFYSRS